MVTAENRASAISLSVPPDLGRDLRVHPDEWVCLVEIEHARPNDVTIVSARVVGHGKTKRESVEQAKVWWAHYSTIGHVYTGKLRAPPPIIRVIVEDETRDVLPR